MLLRRIGYYLGGLSIGLIFVAFIFNKKKTSCSYGPEARVVKNITSKKLKYTTEATNFLYKKEIDTSIFKMALKKGDVDFSKSESRKKPCALYYLNIKLPNVENAIALIDNCEKEATIKKIYSEIE